MLLATAIVCGIVAQNRSDPVAETEIFEGVWYGCHTPSPTAEGRGPVHWARIDLTAPGIELYVTPTDPALDGSGYQYRLKRLGTVARAEGLAVAVNGSLFTREPFWLPGYWPNLRANSVETVVSAGRVNHVWEHTYLLWFGADRAAVLERGKPPPESALARAAWGIGGQAVGLAHGSITPELNRDPTARTAVGVDPHRQLLFLAVFESASPRRAMEELAALGARDGMLLDGGGSTAMVLGEGATGARPGTVLGGWRPVATHFGVRARPKRP
jgi:hypothetical protein